MNFQTLTAMGFNEKAAKVYLAALGNGTASVQTLARKAGLKRSTAYPYIEDLLQQGLLEKVPSGKKEYFRASHPQLLQQRAEKHLEAIKANLPDLLALNSGLPGKPKITLLEGKKGLEQIYNEIIQANSIRFWSNLSKFQRMFPDFFEKVSEGIGSNQIRTKELVSDTPEARRSGKIAYGMAGKFYTAKLGPKEGFENDSVIFGNVVCLFRLHEYELFVVRIEDATIARTMKTLFDMAWQSAKPFIG
jgi:sugar-specific transcriptional regulator TrmB